MSTHGFCCDGPGSEIERSADDVEAAAATVSRCCLRLIFGGLRKMEIRIEFIISEL